MSMQTLCARAASRIFEYPQADYSQRLCAFQQACLAATPAAADVAAEFLKQMAGSSLEDMRELYTRTFDLNPACAPYLSVHLFGESSFKRAQLMTGLAELYAHKGIATHGELPDHLGVVLDALEQLDTGERDDLLKFCLKVALEKMRLTLERERNPYALALSALESLVAGWATKTEVHSD